MTRAGISTVLLVAVSLAAAAPAVGAGCAALAQAGCCCGDVAVDPGCPATPPAPAEGLACCATDAAVPPAIGASVTDRPEPFPLTSTASSGTSAEPPRGGSDAEAARIAPTRSDPVPRFLLHDALLI